MKNKTDSQLTELLRDSINKEVIYETLAYEKWDRYVSEESFAYLVNSMSAMKSASAGIPAIPLYGKKDVSIIDDYYTYAQSKGIHYPQWQLEYELSRKKKFGDQGGRAGWAAIKEDAEMYVLNVQPCRAEENLAMLSKYKQLNLSLPNTRQVLKGQIAADRILAKAAGWNHFEWKKDQPECQENAVMIANSADQKWRDAYAYFFTYIKKQKNRLFVPCGFPLNLLQAKYHDPLLAYIQNDLKMKGIHSSFTFFGDKIGFKNLWPIMQQRISKYDPRHLVYVVRDFYHMDTTMGEEQKLKHYCNKLAAAFNLGGNARKLMEDIICLSNRQPIATPDGMITNRIKGEASGATVTNQGESCDNEDFDDDLNKHILSECRKVGIKAIRVTTHGNGDDGVSIYFLTDISRFDEFAKIVDKCADVQCRRYGHLKNDKWMINLATYGIYCQYELYIGKDNKLHADYPVSLALNAIMHPMHEISKKQWDSDFIDWRNAEILSHLYGREDFTTAIDFVSNGMKYGLFGKTKDDFIRIFSKYKKYKAIRSSEDDFNVVDPNWVTDPRLNPVIVYIAQSRGLKPESLQI